MLLFQIILYNIKITWDKIIKNDFFHLQNKSMNAFILMEAKIYFKFLMCKKSVLQTDD